MEKPNPDEKLIENGYTPFNERKESVTLSWDDLKGIYDYLQDNDFIRTGYRAGYTYKEATLSIFQKHNETLNIWTHLIGVITFLFLFVHVFTHRSLYENEDPTPDYMKYQVWAEILYMFSAIFCMGASAIYHIYFCVNEVADKVGRMFDYIGISVLIVGSIIPIIYYCFYCDALPCYLYIGFEFLTAILVLTATLTHKLSTPKYRPLRTTLYALLGFTPVVPGVHALVKYGIKSPNIHLWIYWIILVAFLYLLGAALYMCRIPERWLPGKCDIWFSSHQLFHLCVFTGCIVHYFITLRLFDWRIAENFKC